MTQAAAAVTVADRLRARLEQAFAPQALQVDDDSARHAGHAGAQGGGHYRVRIVSARFAGMRLLERHRLVYTAVAELLADGIHALQIDAESPQDFS